MPDPRRTPRAVLVTLPGLLLAMQLALLDNAIVGPAMPRIVRELGGLDRLTWIVTAYALTTTITTPLYGFLGDRYGRKRLFLTGIGLFVAGSVLCATAGSMGQLVAFRAVQGLGAGGVIVNVFAVVGDLVPARQRGRVQAWFSANMLVALVAGPLLGGVLADGPGWRWAFLVNLPVGLLAAVLVARTLHLPRPEGDARPPGGLDGPGIALLTVFTTGTVLVTTWGGDRYAWTAPPVLLLGAVAALALAAFVVVERRAAAPLMPFRLFRRRNFAIASLLSLLAGASMFASVTFLPVFVQSGQGATATGTGLALVPLLAGAAVVSLLAGAYVTRTGRHRGVPILGGAAMTAGYALLTRLDADSGRLVTGAVLVVLGTGVGLLMQARMLLTQNGVAPADMGKATGTTTFLQTVGGTVGVAALGAVFNARLAAAHGTGHGGAGLDGAAAVTAASHAVFLVAAALGLVAFAVSWAVAPEPLQGHDETPPGGDRVRTSA